MKEYVKTLDKNGSCLSHTSRKFLVLLLEIFFWEIKDRQLFCISTDMLEKIRKLEFKKSIIWTNSLKTYALIVKEQGERFQ